MSGAGPSREATARAFAARYGRGGRVYRAPGRINLIGEHTDYNDGWVMPAAIDLSAWVGIAGREDRRIRLYSEHFQEAAAFSLDDAGAAVPGWCRSLRGVAVLLERAGMRLSGADVLVRSEVPVGAGLSSSAAVDVGLGWALTATAGAEIERTALAQLCQRASHEFGGARCGIMDLYIAAHGRAGEIVELDTRNLQARWHRWPAELCLVAADTGVRHDHASGEYNRRRAECEAAVAVLARHHAGLTSLREASAAEVEAQAEALGPGLAARCRHVISENARVGAAAPALDRGDYAQMGRLLNDSHASLRDDYAVSCEELDVMADLCRATPGVVGARMMGGGFGGCVLAVAAPAAVNELERRVGVAYEQATGRAARFWVCRPAAGVGQEDGDVETSAPTV